MRRGFRVWVEGFGVCVEGFGVSVSVEGFGVWCQCLSALSVQLLGSKAKK